MRKNEYRLCKCSACGITHTQGTFKDLGIAKPRPHYTYWGDYCGEMELINEPSTPLHWPLIQALVFYKWELEEQ